ncbi:MAG: S-layer family protein [Cyanobacteria bacterium J007]|nr:MAG: S-layer family protein [Cyanobacteria bacterium J007]
MFYLSYAQFRHPKLVFGLWLSLFAFSPGAIAQVIPDGSLPQNTIVTPQGNQMAIDGGTRSGANLFHSFEEFSLTSQQSAIFNNGLDIQNIFSRVTGGKVSEIDGLLQTNGGANLFLLNPSGIVFGPNARLNVGGSFVASSAEAIAFEDGSQFGVRPNSDRALLSIAVPIGLQFGSNPGAIVHRSIAAEGSGNPAGFQVPFGRTLGMIGGDVSIEGGRLGAPEGRIELGSVGDSSFVELAIADSGWSFGYEGVEQWGAIAIGDGARLNTSGRGGGAMQLVGGQIAISGGSQLLAITAGDRDGEPMTLRGNDSIAIASRSTLSTRTQGGGNGGDLRLSGANLTLADGAIVATGTEGAGRGGDLTIEAPGTVQISGADPDNFTLLVGDSTADGAAGAIEMNAGNVFLQGTAAISNRALGNGNGGNISINTREDFTAIGTGFASFETLIGAALSAQLPPDALIGGVFTATNGGGQSGKIIIESGGSVQLFNGASIFSPTFSGAAGGNIEVRADGAIAANASGLLTTTIGNSGAAGNIFLDATRIAIEDGSVVSSATLLGSGSGGDVVLNASDTVEIVRSIPGNLLPTGILNNSILGTGDAGEIRILARRLTIREGGLIVSNTGGLVGSDVITSGGRGGDIIINTSESVEISGISADGVDTSGPGTTSFGDLPAGNLIVTTKRMVVDGGAIVSSATLGAGDGGTLTIRASESLEVRGTSAITGLPTSLTTSSGRADIPQLEATGNGGDLRIFTPELHVSEGAALDVRSLGSGGAGTLEIAAQTVRLDRGGTLNAATVAGTGGNIQVQAPDFILRGGSQITTNAGNTNGGNITIATETLAAIENSDITANAREGRGGRVSIDATGIFGTAFRDRQTPESDITATSALGPEFSGVVEIETPEADPSAGLVEFPSEVRDASNQIATGCAADSGNVFVVTGRGGLPENPTQLFQRHQAWRDLRSPATAEREDFRETTNPATPETQNRRGMLQRSPFAIEATEWTVGSQGEIILKAAGNGSSDPSPFSACPVSRTPE